jgi:tripartite-type tricarboxylate transporter receptor subunit TctC
MQNERPEILIVAAGPAALVSLFARRGAAALLVGLLMLLGPAAWAETYPDKPVTIISDASAGASPDVTTRFIADGLGRKWGQQVIVLNKPGANGGIAARAGADASPDGYTLLMPSLSTFVALPNIAPNVPLKLPRDFLPIGFAADQPMFIAVDPKLGIDSLPQLIERAKQQPNTLAIATSGAGRLTYLTGELLQMRADVKLVTVPYTSGLASAISDVGSGRVSMIIENYAAIVGAAKAGQVKLIATASPQRLPDFPDLPTVAETIPGFSASGWQVLLAPIGTPEANIKKVSDDLRDVLNDAELRKKLAAMGTYPRPMTPEQALSFVNEEQAKWAPVLQRLPGQ